MDTQAAQTEVPIDRRRTTDDTRETPLREFRLLINGELVAGAGTLDVINPATGRLLTVAPPGRSGAAGTGGDRREDRVPHLVGDTLRERATLLVKLAEAIDAERGHFARLLVEEQGKPLAEARWEIYFSIAVLRHVATLDLPPEVLKETATQKVVRLHKPLGSSLKLGELCARVLPAGVVDIIVDQNDLEPPSRVTPTWQRSRSRAPPRRARR